MWAPLNPEDGPLLPTETVPRLAEVLRVPKTGVVGADDPFWEMRTRDQRLAAVRALGATGHPDAVGPLCQALGDLSFPVRQAAAKALRDLADHCPGPELRTAVPLLRRRIAHRRSELPVVQRECRLTLEKIEIVTAGFKDLPLPALAGAQSNETLPRPAFPTVGSESRLPLAALPNADYETPGTRPTIYWAMRFLAYIWPGMLG